MIKNVGKIDRAFRLLLGIFLVWLGIFFMDGKEGNVIGIIVALISLMPFYMVITSSCFVFKWFKIHSLSKKECEACGQPYAKSKE